MLYLNYLFSKYLLIVKRFGSLRERRYICVYYYCYYYLVTAIYWYIWFQIVSLWKRKTALSLRYFPWAAIINTITSYFHRKIEDFIQGCRVTGVRLPEAPTIYPQATKISNREPERAAETYDFQANCLWINSKICTFETKTENVWSSAVGKEYFCR